MTNLVVAKSLPETSEQPTHRPSPAVEDYLRVIYKLARRAPDGRVHTNQLAEELQIRPASVTGMLQKMAAAHPSFIDYHKHKGVGLSAAGRREALAVVRRHRLLELFLHEMLGYTWDEVHEEADRLEHVVSDLFIDRLEEILSNPTADPHGHLIPAADLSLEAVATIPLQDLAAESTATVQHVRDDDPDLLRYLDQIGLRPGARLTVVAAEEAGSREFALEGQLGTHVIEPEIARQIAMRIEYAQQADDLDE